MGGLATIMGLIDIAAGIILFTTWEIPVASPLGLVKSIILLKLMIIGLISLP